MTGNNIVYVNKSPRLFFNDRCHVLEWSPCCWYMSLLTHVILFTELAAKCCCEAGIWYYRILEILVNQERKRPSVRDISVSVLPSCGHKWNWCTFWWKPFFGPVGAVYDCVWLFTNNRALVLVMCLMQGNLENDLIQCCLVVCCLEITITSTPLPCDFPLVLHIFKLAPYHFWKVCLLSCLCTCVDSTVCTAVSVTFNEKCRKCTTFPGRILHFSYFSCLVLSCQSSVQCTQLKYVQLI